MLKENPKQIGSSLHDCRTQTGLCPLDCNQCFYNRPNAFYTNIDKPYLPKPEDVKDGIVRMNCGHDSNIKREEVIKQAKKYKNFFFNTSIPNFDFPNPVVFTANRNEEEWVDFSFLGDKHVSKLMFVRLRVSSSNLERVERATKVITRQYIPVVLTFMRYFDKDQLSSMDLNIRYEYKTSIINNYYCPKESFKREVLRRMKSVGSRLVTTCGTMDSSLCRDCLNCLGYYYIAKKRLSE